MRVRVLSDLHLEFMPDWRAWVDALDNDCDVLVLAGDIATTEIELVLRRFSRRFENVVFVPGNHEFYGSSTGLVRERLDAVQSELDNLHYLDPGTVRIGSLGPDGQRFLGATLWFEETPEAARHLRAGMNDFSVIRDLEPWVYEQNKQTRQWLAEHLRKGDVVVTHHLPSARCVHPKYIGSPLNRFFLGCMTRELDDLIEERQPALWIHGHTHESVDIRIGVTRVVCNPYGYHGHEVNPAFDPALNVEV